MTYPNPSESHQQRDVYNRQRSLQQGADMAQQQNPSNAYPYPYPHDPQSQRYGPQQPYYAPDPRYPQPLPYYVPNQQYPQAVPPAASYPQYRQQQVMQAPAARPIPTKETPAKVAQAKTTPKRSKAESLALVQRIKKWILTGSVASFATLSILVAGHAVGTTTTSTTHASSSGTQVSTPTATSTGTSTAKSTSTSSSGSNSSSSNPSSSNPSSSNSNSSNNSSSNTGGSYFQQPQSGSSIGSGSSQPVTSSGAS